MVLGVNIPGTSRRKKKIGEPGYDPRVDETPEATANKNVQGTPQERGEMPQGQPVTQSKVTLNPNDTFTVNEGGKTFELTRQEFESRLPTSTTPKSPQVQALMQVEERERIRRQIDEKLRQGATIAEITKELLEAEGARQGIAPQQITPVQQEMIDFSQQQPLVEESQLTGQKQKEVYAPNAIPNKVARFLGNETPQLKPAAALGEIVVKPISEVYDFVYSLTQGGKGITQKEAENTFSRVESDMLQDLALVKVGLKDPQQVKQNIQLAEQAITRLENSVKGLGKWNLRYWLVDGKDVETQLALNRQAIQDYKIQLIQAQQEAVQYAQTQQQEANIKREAEISARYGK